MSRTFLYVQDLIHQFILELGGNLLILWEGLKALFHRPFRLKLIFKQMEFIGVHSSFIIMLTGFFVGAVLTLQGGRTLRLINAETMTGAGVVVSLLRELGPVITSFMIAARCGSAMAAEIGTMRVTQQIDALEVMAVNPMSYLIAPRILASLVMVPLLTTLFNFMGMVGTYIVGVQLLSISEGPFFDRIETFTESEDLWDGLVKAACFGVVIAVVGCRKGYLTEGGAEGVGRATTQAVVVAAVTILILDYFITALMF